MPSTVNVRQHLMNYRWTGQSPVHIFMSIKTINMDWKAMGFKSEKDYHKFLDTKRKELIDKIKNDPKLLAVFKRLNNK